MQTRTSVQSSTRPASTRIRGPVLTVGYVLVVSLLATTAEVVVPTSGAFLVAGGLALLWVRVSVVPVAALLVAAAGRMLDRCSTSNAEPRPSQQSPRAERELLRAGVFTVADGEYRPSDAFVAAWQRRVLVPRARERDATALAEALGLPAGSVTVEPTGGLLIARTPEGALGTWLSRAALVADTASVAELRRRDARWDARSPRLRGAMLATIRLHLHACPVCDGELHVDDGVRSRAPGRTGPVVAVTCAGCDARLFESGFGREIRGRGDTSTSVTD